MTFPMVLGCYSFKDKQPQPHLRACSKQSGGQDWIAAPVKDLTPIFLL